MKPGSKGLPIAVQSRPMGGTNDSMEIFYVMGKQCVNLSDTASVLDQCVVSTKK